MLLLATSLGGCIDSSNQGSNPLDRAEKESTSVLFVCENQSSPCPNEIFLPKIFEMEDLKASPQGDLLVATGRLGILAAPTLFYSMDGLDWVQKDLPLVNMEYPTYDWYGAVDAIVDSNGAIHAIWSADSEVPLDREPSTPIIRKVDVLYSRASGPDTPWDVPVVIGSAPSVEYPKLVPGTEPLVATWVEQGQTAWATQTPNGWKIGYDSQYCWEAEVLPTPVGLVRVCENRFAFDEDTSTVDLIQWPESDLLRVDRFNATGCGQRSISESQGRVIWVDSCGDILKWYDVTNLNPSNLSLVEMGSQNMRDIKQLDNYEHLYVDDSIVDSQGVIHVYLVGSHDSRSVDGVICCLWEFDTLYLTIHPSGLMESWPILVENDVIVDLLLLDYPVPHVVEYQNGVLGLVNGEHRRSWAQHTKTVVSG